MKNVGNTKNRATTLARQILQENGYNGLTFQLVADGLGIKKPSLFDHFKSKEDLALNIIEEAKQSFKDWSDTVNVFDPDSQIGAFFEIIYKFSCSDLKLCPISAFIGDYNSYPQNIKNAIEGLYKTRYEWLENIITEGQQRNMMTQKVSSTKLTQLVLSIIFGSQLMARATNSPECIRDQKEMALKILKGEI